MRTSSSWRVVPLIGLGGLLAACPKPLAGGGSASASASVSVTVTFPDPPASTAAPIDDLADRSHASLAACATGDVDANLAIVADFRDSCHEMIICGGLTNTFSGAVFRMLVNAALGHKTGVDHITYQGDGRYRVGDVMTLQMRLGADMSFGHAGDVIPFDVLDLGTYFKRASISASASYALGGRAETSYAMTFDEVGPGVELLGLSRDTAGPLKLQFQAMADALGHNVHAAQDITVSDHKGASAIDYHLSGPPTPIANLLGGAPAAQELTSIDARRTDTNQTIAVTNWAMQYQPGSTGTLDGSITFEVRGGAFPYQATFTYPHRKEPDVALSCL
ncbi:MAG: hypothetical protein IPL61_34605 [Myxococcales bacterium]|nr:hypothetical protein [Myxococcales bacterium]